MSGTVEAEDPPRRHRQASIALMRRSRRGSTSHPKATSRRRCRRRARRRRPRLDGWHRPYRLDDLDRQRPLRPAAAITVRPIDPRGPAVQRDRRQPEDQRDPHDRPGHELEGRWGRREERVGRRPRPADADDAGDHDRRLERADRPAPQTVGRQQPARGLRDRDQRPRFEEPADTREHAGHPAETEQHDAHCPAGDGRQPCRKQHRERKRTIACADRNATASNGFGGSGRIRSGPPTSRAARTRRRRR